MKTIKTLLLLCFVLASTALFSQISRGEQADSTQKGPPVIEKEPEVFMVVEVMPKFPGGDEAMFKFISKRVKYPKEARKKNIQGRVMIQFVVDEEGNIIEAKVVKGIGYGCDEEALRVINSMPKWKPGTQKGKPVRVRFVIPIRFVLED